MPAISAKSCKWPAPNAWLHTDYVADLVLHALIEAHQEINGPHCSPRHSRQKLSELRAGGRDFQVWTQFARQGSIIGKGILLSGGLQKKVEGIEYAHFGDQIDLYQKLGGRLGKYQPGEVIALRILLPVNEMIFGTDLQGIGQRCV